ncbi:hypothetical protein B0H14DRAFT_3507145 [Mycena olivaceomarginata]|nr:hypothetical protein B0H14DRAFT_3507145 [Mycena olivaceomarginata]
MLRAIVLASILPSFPHLECLGIKGRLGLSVKWNDMILPLQSAIEDLMTSTNLRSLDLEEIFDIPSSFIILALSSLRRLGLHSIAVEPSESHVPYPPALQTEEITLRTQYINVKSIVDSILPDIPRPGYLDKIRWLVLGMHQDIHAESLRLIASKANTLRHLELRCGVFELPLDLPRLPVLQVLELKIFLSYGPGLPLHLYPVVAALPTTIPTLEVLRLTFYGALPDEDDWGPDRAGPLPLFDDACARGAGCQATSKMDPLQVTVAMHAFVCAQFFVAGPPPAPIAQNFRLCAGCIATGGQISPSIKRSTPPSTRLSSKDSPDCGALESSRFLLVATRAHLEDMAGATYTGIYCHLYCACDAMERVVRESTSDDPSYPGFPSPLTVVPYLETLQTQFYELHASALENVPEKEARPATDSQHRGGSHAAARWAHEKPALPPSTTNFHVAFRSFQHTVAPSPLLASPSPAVQLFGPFVHCHCHSAGAGVGLILGLLASVILGSVKLNVLQAEERSALPSPVFSFSRSLVWAPGLHLQRMVSGRKHGLRIAGYISPSPSPSASPTLLPRTRTRSSRALLSRILFCPILCCPRPRLDEMGWDDGICRRALKIPYSCTPSHPHSHSCALRSAPPGLGMDWMDAPKTQPPRCSAASSALSHLPPPSPPLRPQALDAVLSILFERLE